MSSCTSPNDTVCSVPADNSVDALQRQRLRNKASARHVLGNTIRQPPIIHHPNYQPQYHEGSYPKLFLPIGIHLQYFIVNALQIMGITGCGGSDPSGRLPWVVDIPNMYRALVLYVSQSVSNAIARAIGAEYVQEPYVSADAYFDDIHLPSDCDDPSYQDFPADDSEYHCYCLPHTRELNQLQVHP